MGGIRADYGRCKALPRGDFMATFRPYLEAMVEAGFDFRAEYSRHLDLLRVCSVGEVVEFLRGMPCCVERVRVAFPAQVYKIPFTGDGVAAMGGGAVSWCGSSGAPFYSLVESRVMLYALFPMGGVGRFSIFPRSRQGFIAWCRRNGLSCWRHGEGGFGVEVGARIGGVWFDGWRANGEGYSVCYSGDGDKTVFTFGDGRGRLL